MALAVSCLADRIGGAGRHALEPDVHRRTRREEALAGRFGGIPGRVPGGSGGFGEPAEHRSGLFFGHFELPV